MNSRILISICIPAYKNTSYLQRLLNSIIIQTFKNYEVIITDDSPDDSVKDFLTAYNSIESLRYFRNPLPLGTPENWNAAIQKASGKWVKLMHDDDWFADADSLQQFVNRLNKTEKYSFIYSAYTNVDLDSNQKKPIWPSYWRRILLRSDPASLLSKNIIGPPSAVMYRNEPGIIYDRQLKWLVDIDFYIRYLKHNQALFIKEDLIHIGLSTAQVTKYSSLVSQVEIPEFFTVLEKLGVRSLNNILVYDACWRLLRNFSITSADSIYEAGYNKKLPNALESMITFQAYFPRGILKVGFFSKLLMGFHFLAFRLR